MHTHIPITDQISISLPHHSWEFRHHVLQIALQSVGESVFRVIEKQFEIMSNSREDKI